MSTPRRGMLTTVAAVAAVAGVAVAGTLLTLTGGAARLSAGGPVRVGGTTVTAAFPYGNAVVREVRYVDTGRLSYSFTLANRGALPVRVTGLAPWPEQRHTLLRPQALTRASDGAAAFTVWPGDRVRARLVVVMRGCEWLSSRAGSLLHQIRVRAAAAGVAHREVRLALPERVHTGSPRDANCPGSSTATRSPG